MLAHRCRPFTQNMYQGVVKDEKRRKDRAEAKAKVSDVLPTSLSAVVPDAVNDIPLPSSSTLPSVLGFDPPQAAPAGGKSDAQKEKDYRSRQRDFELSQMRREKLLADQGLVDGDK
jgi:hypothetical protein